MGNDDCLSRKRLTLYLENRLEPEARGRLEEHLSRCHGCRRRLVESYERRVELPDVRVPEDLRRQAREMPVRVPSPVRWRMALAAVVVAALGLPLLLRDGRLETPPDPDALRDPPASAGLELLSPATGVSVTSATVAFNWRGVPGARRYTVSVVDGLGDVIHRGTSSEPSLSVPAVTFETAREYFWYVTAVLDDGTVQQSEVWSFATLRHAPQNP